MNSEEFILKYCNGAGVTKPPKENLVHHLAYKKSEVTKNANTGIYELVDKIGKETRPIQAGRCWYFDGSTNYITTAYFLGINSINKGIRYNGVSFLVYTGGSTTGVVNWTKQDKIINFKVVRITPANYDIYIDNIKIGTCDSGNVTTITIDVIGDMSTALTYPFKGYIQNIIIGKYNFNCEEQAGNISRSIDTSHITGAIHGTISGFHAIDKTREDSRCNEIGYALKSGVDGLIPLDLAGNPTVADCDTVYKGRVKYNERVIGTNYLKFDGSTNYLTGILAGDETIISKVGTSTLTILENRIDATHGTLASFELSNGSIYSVGEGNSNFLYDRVNDNHLIIAGTVDDDTWQQDDTGLLRPINLIDGFDLWTKDAGSTELRIPFNINGNSIKTEGDTITGYTWQSRNTAGSWLNNSENNLSGYSSPTMRKVDKDIEFIYDISGDVKEYNPSELQFDQEDDHKEFADVNKTNKIKNIVRYKEQLSNDLTRVNKFIKKP